MTRELRFQWWRRMRVAGMAAALLVPVLLFVATMAMPGCHYDALIRIDVHEGAVQITGAQLGTTTTRPAADKSVADIIKENLR